MLMGYYLYAELSGRKTTFCWLSKTAYLVYLQLSSVSGDKRPTYYSCEKYEYAILIHNFMLEYFQGKVVESCSSLGIYELHDSSRLCLAFLMKYTDVPLPSVGQTISVYNGHWLKNECDDRYDLVLCGRSCIVLQ
jgi:hypothetical protein